jgi:hypothetical protein
MSSNVFPACASGSCSSSTKLLVPVGGLTHESGGEVILLASGGPPAIPGTHEYFSGSSVPSANAELLSCSGGPIIGRPPPPPPCCATAGTALAASKNAIVMSGFVPLIRIPSVLPFFACLRMIFGSRLERRSARRLILTPPRRLCNEALSPETESRRFAFRVWRTARNFAIILTGEYECLISRLLYLD